jgi:preprotein translocase subunit SecG
MTTVLYFLTLSLFLLLCLLLCGVIMIQEGKAGLGSSFGGDSTDSLFGTSTADVLKQFTGWLAFIFLVACVLLSFWTSSMGRGEETASPPGAVEEIQE